MTDRPTDQLNDAVFLEKLKVSQLVT